MASTQNPTMIVAFGINNTQHFVAAGTRTSSFNLPAEMYKHITSNLREPITFASMGPGQKYFIAGHQPAHPNKEQYYWSAGDIQERLSTAAKQGSEHFIRGASFGADNAYAWWSNSRCFHTRLGDLRLGWVKKMEAEYPDKHIAKLFLGTDNKAVIIWDDGEFSNFVSHRLGDVFAGARNEGIRPIHVSLSSVDPNWFFVQFDDMSVTWWVAKEFSEQLKSIAKGLGVKHRLSNVDIPVTE